MGFFSNYNAIGRINALIKQLEPKLDYIASELQYPYSANKERLRVECGTVSVLMSEIADIVQSSGRSVFLAPYYFKGKKNDNNGFTRNSCIFSSASRRIIIVKHLYC